MDRLWPGSIWQKLKLVFVSDQASGKKSEPGVKAAKDERTADEQVNAVAGAFRGGLGVDPVKDSQLVSIRYDSPECRLLAAGGKCCGRRLHRIEPGASIRLHVLRQGLSRGQPAGTQAQTGGLGAQAGRLRPAGTDRQLGRYVRRQSARAKSGKHERSAMPRRKKSEFAQRRAGSRPRVSGRAIWRTPARIR